MSAAAAVAPAPSRYCRYCKTNHRTVGPARPWRLVQDGMTALHFSKIAEAVQIAQVRYNLGHRVELHHQTDCGGPWQTIAYWAPDLTAINEFERRAA